MKPSFTVFHLLLPATLLVLSGCKSEQTRPPAPPPAQASAPTPASAQAAKPARAELSSEFTASALVAAIAPEERVLTLRREDGSLFDVQAGPEVRNFAQIAVGDELRVRYKAMLAATKLPPGEAARPGEGAFAAARAKEGSKPGAGMGIALSARVKIESIDRPRGIVVFSLASGELVAHRVQTSQGREFLEGLAVGDTVQLDYKEALALGIEKL